MLPQEAWRPFAHCTYCGARYDYSDATPATRSFCPDCRPARRATMMLPYTTDHRYHGKQSDGTYILVTYEALTERVRKLEQLGVPGPWYVALDPDNWDPCTDGGCEIDEDKMSIHRQAEAAERNRHDLRYSPVDGHSYEWHAAADAAKARW